MHTVHNAETILGGGGTCIRMHIRRTFYVVVRANKAILCMYSLTQNLGPSRWRSHDYTTGTSGAIRREKKDTQSIPFKHGALEVWRERETQRRRRRG